MRAFGLTASVQHNLLLGVLCGALAACAGTAGESPTATLRPTPTGGSISTPLPTATPPASPTIPPWPAGWDAAFCTAYGDIVIAQELARDIGRALADDDRDDALGLTNELVTTIETVRGALLVVPAWSGADATLAAIDAMLGDDAQEAEFYGRYLELGREQSLPKAREYETRLREESVPAVESALAGLGSIGFECPGLSFDLETPDAS